MTDASIAPPPRIRFVCRRSVQAPIDTRVRGVRPTVVQPRLPGDYWVEDGDGETLTVCLDDYEFAQIRGLPLDQPAFNHLIDRIHHRRPRRR